MGTICIILLLRGTDTKMDGFEEDPNPRKNMIFLNSKDNFSNRMSTRRCHVHHCLVSLIHREDVNHIVSS